MLAIAIAASAPALVRADATSPAEREAQARFEEGLARVKASNFEGARVSFTQAYAVLHKPYILWNLALAEEKTGHTLEALAHFKQFTSTSPGGDDEASARRHVAELMVQVGHVDVAAPAGAQVVVDGTPAGVAPLAEPVDVLPGRHHLEARGAQETNEADADVTAGQLVHVSLARSAEPPGALASPAAPAEPPASPPSSADTLPLTPPDVGAGTAGRELSAARVMSVVVVGAAAAASLSLGIYFGVQSQNEKGTGDTFRQTYPSNYCTTMGGSAVCAQWNDAVQSQARDATLSNVFYATSGALAAGALLTWFLWPSDSASSKPAAWLSPALGPDGAGLGAAGRF